MNIEEYLNKDKKLRNLFNKVKDEFIKITLSGHNWDHVSRCISNAIKVGEQENAKMNIVLARIVLHDIGRLYEKKSIQTSLEDHMLIGIGLAKKYLEESGYNQEEIEEILHCIKAHEIIPLEEPKTLEAMVVHDADALEKSGKNIPLLSEMCEEFGMEFKDLISLTTEVLGKALTNNTDFYTKTGKDLGKDGLLEMYNFCKKLKEESNS